MESNVLIQRAELKVDHKRSANDVIAIKKLLNNVSVSLNDICTMMQNSINHMRTVECE